MKQVTGATKFYYNDSFIFECDESFKLMGSSNNTNDGSVVRCMEDGYWDLGDLRCIGVNFIFL